LLTPLAAAKTHATPAAAATMSITGEVHGEGSDGEEVFIDDEDIINEIPLDEEGQCYLHKSTFLLTSASSVLTAGLAQTSPTRTTMTSRKKT
jgi:hypothetical protein